MKLLDANGEDATRVTGLRAIHALAARSGDILRHRVGIRACVDAVWAQLLPCEKMSTPTEEEIAAAEEAGTPKPEPVAQIVSPSTAIVFHALRCLATMASCDWESTHLVVGAPEGVVELARDLTPLCDILKPDSEIGKVEAVRAKAARLVKICMRTRIGRECLLRRGGLVPSLLAALAPVAKYTEGGADGGADGGGGKDADIADAAFPPEDAISEQILEEQAKDQALEDAMDYLDEALGAKKIELEPYLEFIRELSKEQFFARATTMVTRKAQRERGRSQGVTF